MGKNYYEILGVPENASDADIETAFKVKAREVHPDTVSVDNPYLRQVASEAFKDLSEAKAALLDPTARQKFDASLEAERERNRESTNPSSSSAESTDSSSPHRTRGGSRTGSSRRAQSAPRVRASSSPFPEIRNLNSFLFMVLGMATIFFLAVLVASGRMPPLWLAVVTAAIGILLFVNGMRPVRGFTSGRPTLIGSAIAVTCILLALWLVSPSYFEMATTSHIAHAVASHTIGSKPQANNSPRQSVSPRVLADSAPNEVVDMSGSEAMLPTRVWSNLKDGQNYRSRLDGNTLYLDAIAMGGKIGGQFAGCEFHRNGTSDSDWAGMCTELGGNGEALHKLPASLNRFSNDRIEGSTADIPVFVMTPIDSVQMTTNGAPNTNEAVSAPGASPLTGATPGALTAANTPPASGNATPGFSVPTTSSADPNATAASAPQNQDTTEPDLSALKKADKESVELTCASERLSQGVAKYNDCLRKQLDSLKAAPNPPSLAGLSSAEREDVVLTCSNEKLIHGPGAYNACLVQQLKKKKKLK